MISSITHLISLLTIIFGIARLDAYIPAFNLPLVNREWNSSALSGLAVPLQDVIKNLSAFCEREREVVLEGSFPCQCIL